MSRVAKRPVTISQDVTVEVAESTLTVKGPKGSLSMQVRPEGSIASRIAEWLPGDAYGQVRSGWQFGQTCVPRPPTTSFDRPWPQRGQ